MLAHLDDDAVRVIGLRCEPDLAMMATRMVAGFERDRQADVMAVGSGGAWTGPDAFYERCMGALGRHLSDNEQALQRFGMRSLGPDALVTPSARYAPEVRFAAMVEQLGRRVAGLVRHVVLVLHIEADPSERTNVAVSLGKLAVATGSARVTYLVIEPRAQPWTVETDMETLRWQRMVAGGAEPELRYRTFLNAAASRLLTCCDRASTDVIFRQGDRSGDAQRCATRTVRLTAPFVDAWQYAAAITQAARAIAPSIVASNGEGASLYADLCERVERGAHADLGEATQLVLLLAPERVDAEHAFFSFVLGIEREAASPNVKFVVAHAGLAAYAPHAEAPELLAPPPSRVRMAATELHVSPEQIEGELEQLIADNGSPSVPSASQPTQAAIRRRCRALGMLASFALSRGQHGRSLDLASEAVAASGDLGDGDEQAIALHVLGHALYRQEAFGEARAAYAAAAKAAFAQEKPHLAGQALVSMGHAHFAARELDDAMHAYRRGDPASRAASVVPLFRALALVWLAESQRQLDQRDEAQASLEEALALYEGMAWPLDAAASEGRADVLLRLSRLRAEMGARDEAATLREHAKRLGAPSHPVKRP